MTDYDDLDREESLVAGDIKGYAAKRSQELERSGALDDSDDSDDDVFEYLDSEALASWNLKRIRAVLGVSQQEISERLKKSRWGIRLAQTQIAKIERGERPWRVNEMFAIAEVLGISWDELFRGNGLTDDPKLVLLASRLKYQQLEDAEGEARVAWRQAAIEAQKAGLKMCRTAARLGIDDPEVRRFLRMQYFYGTWLDSLDQAKPQETYAERDKQGEEYAESEWQRLLEEVRQDKDSAED